MPRYRNLDTGRQASVHPSLTGYYDAHPLWVPIDRQPAAPAVTYIDNNQE